MRCRRRRCSTPLFSSGRGDGSVKITADPRTNSILARGPAETLREIEALVLRLDASQPAQVGAARDGTGRGAGPAVAQMPGDPAMLNRLATERLQQYRGFERQASGIAEIRKLTKGTPGAQSANPSRRFCETVEAAFEARQEASARRAGTAPPRLARIEENIETRHGSRMRSSSTVSRSSLSRASMDAAGRGSGQQRETAGNERERRWLGRDARGLARIRATARRRSVGSSRGVPAAI